jgi:hypothetical protein
MDWKWRMHKGLLIKKRLKSGSINGLSIRMVSSGH